MKFNYQAYKPFKEFEDKEGNQVFLYSDDDSNECAVVVDSDNNILSDSTTGECGCRNCRENTDSWQEEQDQIEAEGEAKYEFNKENKE